MKFSRPRWSSSPKAPTAWSPPRRASPRLLRGKHTQEYAVGVKEIISLPQEKIEDRFNLAPHEGAAMDFVGVPFKGTVGGGFIYTAKEAIHVGAVMRIASLVEAKRNPSEILDAFKRHPRIRR
jgi:electron transfer flavoprotein-quinone oxidoreductase